MALYVNDEDDEHNNDERKLRQPNAGRHRYRLPSSERNPSYDAPRIGSMSSWRHRCPRARDPPRLRHGHDVRRLVVLAHRLLSGVGEQAGPELLGVRVADPPGDRWNLRRRWLSAVVARPHRKNSSGWASTSTVSDCTPPTGQEQSVVFRLMHRDSRPGERAGGME